MSKRNLDEGCLQVVIMIRWAAFYGPFSGDCPTRPKESKGAIESPFQVPSRVALDLFGLQQVPCL